MTQYQSNEVVETGGQQTVVSARRRRFSPGQVIGGLAGLVLTVIGALAVTRSGIDSSLNQPLTDVAGLSQSALVGLIELGAGLLLIVSAASIELRGLMGFIGALLIAAGIVTAASSTTMLNDLGTEKASGWLLVVIGVVSLVAAMMPSFIRRDRTVSSTPMNVA